MREATPKICPECDNQITSPYRKLCWSCTNIHRRYKMSKAEWQKKRVREGKICCICRAPARHLYASRPVCWRCKIALEVLMDPEKRRRLVEDFS